MSWRRVSSTFSYISIFTVIAVVVLYSVMLSALQPSAAASCRCGDCYATSDGNSRKTELTASTPGNEQPTRKSHTQLTSISHIGESQITKRLSKSMGNTTMSQSNREKTNRGMRQSKPGTITPTSFVSRNAVYYAVITPKNSSGKS